MALQIKEDIILADDCKSFTVGDITGSYSSSNTTGYGTAVIPAITYITYAIDSNIDVTKQGSSTTYTINTSSFFPDYTNLVTASILNTDLGLTSTDTIPDGIYNIDYRVKFAFNILSVNVGLKQFTLSATYGDVSNAFVAGDTITVYESQAAPPFLNNTYSYTIASINYTGGSVVLTVNETVTALTYTIKQVRIEKHASQYQIFSCTSQNCLNQLLSSIEVADCTDCFNSKVQLASKINTFLLAAKDAARCGKPNKAQVILNYINELCSITECESCK